MAGAAGPNTAESGLVFAYDTGNTVTSYLGEPLVNCATDLSSGYNVTVTEVTDGSISPPFPGMRVYKFVTANNYNLHRQGGYYNGGGFGGSNPQPLILGTTTPSNFTTVGTGKYRFGMYIRGEVTNQVGDSVTIDIGDRNQVGTTVGTNTNWQLLQTDDTLGIADSNYPYDFFDIGASFSMTFYVAGYGIWRSPGTVTNLPFLQAYPISTQYITYGQSRSVTQGLLNLTGNGVINITNASFNSNAQLVFDGTNDLIFTADSTYLDPGSSPFSIELVFNCSNASVGEGILYNKEDLYETAIHGGIFQYAWQPHWAWDGDSTFPVSSNTWYHAVVTYDGSYQRMYKNGVEVYNRAQSGNMGSNSNVLSMGARGVDGSGGSGYNFFPGQIPVVKAYKAALSATEVKQNFEAIRDRFGI